MRLRPCIHPTTSVRGWSGLLLGLLLVMSASASAGDDWVLRGTIVLGDHRGYAILEPPRGGGQVLRAVGEQLVPGMRLEAVATDHALVRQQGIQRRLVFGMRLSGEPPTSHGDTAIRVDLRQLPEIIAAVDLIPHQQQGRLDGYYANAVPEPLRARIGLQPGDLLRRVNGIPLDERVDAGELYRQLEAGTLVVEIERQGRPMTLRYRLGG